MKKISKQKSQENFDNSEKKVGDIENNIISLQNQINHLHDDIMNLTTYKLDYDDISPELKINLEELNLSVNESGIIE